MNDTHSILWSDAAREQDRNLVSYLVKKIVAGEKVPGHHAACVEKIMSNIQTTKWQMSFPYRTHVFSVYYGISLRSVAEIKFSLHAQALELLYFNVANASDVLEYNVEAKFEQKLRDVFQDIYNWNMPDDTINAIRILRNDVVHTGTIAGVAETYRKQNVPARLNQFFEYYEFNKNQQNTNIQNRMHLAHMFNMLMQDILIRTLGLDQTDLNFNLAPAWRADIFGYNHENRPDWLRDYKGAVNI